MATRRRAIGTTAVAFTIIIAAVIAGLGAVALIRLQQSQPCYVVNGVIEPGVSEVTVNGVVKCVAGPPVIVNDDGRIDFRNGTVVDLHANLTGASFIGGSTYDTVVTLNETRFIFNAYGLIATIYPYQGREVFANGTVTTFPVCAYPISTSILYPRGTYGNGTDWLPAAGGGIVRFYPNGTCSAVASSVSGFKASSTWNFTVSISSSAVEQGLSVQLVARLTNISPTNQTIQNYVEPYINPEVYASNGTAIWAWNPPEATWPTWTIPSGQTLTQTVNIPTSELSIGQTYTIKVAPLSQAITAQGNLTITIQFSVSGAQ
jgi:hypothetical protein